MRRSTWRQTGIWAVAIALALLMACSQDTTGNGNTGTADGGNANPDRGKQPAAAEEAPVVTALMGRGTDFPEENPVLDEIRKRSGIHLEVQTVLFSEEQTRLNTLLVSGQAPDFFNVNKQKLKELAENDVIMPLNDLLETHGQEVLADKGDHLEGPAYIDGNIYGIPRATGNSAVLAIRQDWLDTLGLEVPTTLEGYEEVLRAFTYDDPDGNGEDDTIGLGLGILYTEAWSHIFGAFGVPQYRYVMEGEQIVPWMLAPGYLDAVKYLNKLYHEGLIETEFATIPRLQLVEKLWNGKAGAWQAGAEGISTNWVTRYVEDPKPKFVYTAIKGPDGQGGSLKTHPEDSGNYTVINKKAKNPEAVMDVLNYLSSREGDTLTYYGIEGVHYRLADGQLAPIPPYDDAVALRNEGGFMYTELINRQDALKLELYTEETKHGNEVARTHTIDEVYLYELPQVQIDKGTMLSDMEAEFRAKAMMGERAGIDALYAKFKENFLREGGSKWIEQATEIYRNQQ
ncbi:extracellular solute-binding protein [Paenibacillus sp. IB182496]|uniref:Extracellular solute-binding protein n=1 Tax=Paenibacillus sabuli TaxID=2772509 RepID=A0A927GT39_9BACL|nr:extracellular solute-binding protein [Paenibacillus sabuli]MBD2846317.1 extracellular solute-binding protein [Paenibacillus sabuli]